MQENKRARQGWQKEERAQAILDAASSLFEENGGKLSTVSEVAERASIAKGTVYLYYQTKEEIYLALMQRHMLQMTDDILDLLHSAGPQVQPEAIADACCDHLFAHPITLQLSSLTQRILGENVAEDKALEFTTTQAERIKQIGDVLAEVFPQMDVASLAQVTIYGYVLVIGLWQLHHHPLAAKTIITPIAYLIPAQSFKNKHGRACAPYGRVPFLSELTAANLLADCRSYKVMSAAATQQRDLFSARKTKKSAWGKRRHNISFGGFRMNRSVFSRVLMSTTLTGGLLAGGSAFAAIDEIVVTAQKRESTLQDTSISLAVFDNDALIRSGISTAQDLAQFTPNVVMTNNSNISSPEIYIRGVGTSSPRSLLRYLGRILY